MLAILLSAQLAAAKRGIQFSKMVWRNADRAIACKSFSGTKKSLESNNFN